MPALGIGSGAKLGAGWWSPSDRNPRNGGSLGMLGSYQRIQFFYADPVVALTAGGAVLTDQDLKSVALAGKTLNRVNRFMRVTASGVVASAAGITPTWRIKLWLGALVLIQFPDVILPASLIGAWRMRATVVVVSRGAAATLESHGDFLVRNSNVVTTPSTPLQDANVAVSAPIDLTVAQTLKLTAQYTTNANAGNVTNEREFIVEVLDGTLV